MASVDAEPVEWDRPTRPPSIAGPPDPPMPAGCSSLLLCRKGEILAATRTGKDPILVGRSSRCALRTDDPTFPGVAGEVILRPVPLFHAWRDGQKEGKRVLLFKKDAPLHLGVFRLWLLTSGTPMKNRKARAGRTMLILPFMALALSLSAMGAFALRRTADAGSQRQSQAAGGCVEGRSSSRTGAISARTTIQPPAGAAAAPLHAAALPATPSPETSPPTVLDQGVFSQLTQAAISALRKEDPRSAGTVVSPFLPLMSPGQRADLSSILEPHAGRIFRRAYLGLPYDPVGSRKRLAALSECGIEMLPTARKARLLIERRGTRRAEDPP
jgi:hypothetical protein